MATVVTKILLTADWHLSDNPRDEYRWDFPMWLHKYIRDNGIDELYLLGDITEAKDHHSGEFVNDVVEVFFNLTKRVPITILKGNHDAVGDSDPFFQFLRHVSAGGGNNIHWQITCSNPKLGNDIMLIPHMPNPEDWKHLKFDGVHTIFTHNTFKGANLGFIQAEDGLSLDLIPKGINVISGDVHVPQLLSGRLTYVGAPYTIDFGDDYEPRVLVVENGKIKQSVPVPGRQKRLIDYDVVKGGLAKLTRQLNKGDIVKVRVTDERMQVNNWQELKDEITEWLDKVGCTPYLIQLVRHQQASRQQFQHRKQHDDPTLLKTYGKHRNIAEPVVNTGLNIMTKEK